MRATIASDENLHYPVLLSEVLSIISPQNGGTFIDCTFGQGGYTEKILEFPNTKVIAFDRDSKSKNIAIKFKQKFKNRFEFYNKKFSDIDSIKLPKTINGIIFDLGFSYNQIRDKSKGLSFNHTGQLNMKMGCNKISADDIIKKLPAKDLEKIFKYFGEERDSKKIAYKIIKERKIKEIDTQKLVKIIESSKIKKNYKIHSATKVFQALRIFVNKEISELIYGLINAAKVVDEGGIIAVVSFHSLEDKIIKYFFRSLSKTKGVSRYMPQEKKKNNLFKLINKKPITPSTEEIKENKPSRSAKLRFAIKEKNISNFETDILNKFNYLIKIENYSEKL